VLCQPGIPTQAAASSHGTQGLHTPEGSAFESSHGPCRKRRTRQVR
jgi:hypothetical protein